MIIHAGSIDLAPEDRDRFIAVRRDQMVAARALPGCLEYVISADPIESGRVQVFECFRDEAALAQHHQSFQQRGDIPIRAMNVLRYDVDEADRRPPVWPPARAE
jgi:quinol monooxygenase YgiN